MINWKVRLLSKQFWLGIVGAVGTAAVAITSALGIEYDASQWVTTGSVVVTSMFSVLSLVGIVTDPTTAGMGDSALALTYDEPRASNPGSIEVVEVIKEEEQHV